MKIVVLRHGFVKPSEDIQDSSVDYFKNLGEQISSIGQPITLIGTSPITRALRSAEAFAQTTGTEIVKLDWLEQDSTEGEREIRELIESHPGPEVIVLFTHWPRIRSLMVYLMEELTGDPDGPWLTQEIECCDGWCVSSSGEASFLPGGCLLSAV